ncbi:MAG TPA: hypothetical protein VIG38_02065 [Hyphomicrobium sp.]
MERTWSCLDCRFENAEPICFTAGGTFDPQRLARAFLKIKTTSVTRDEVGDDSSHAFDCIDEMVQEAPGMAVVFLLAALDVCETVEQVAVLGAGPLENLLKAHGIVVIGDLEREARKHAKVRYLLSSTWGQSNIDPGVWDRLVIAVAPGLVMDGDGRTPGVGLYDKILDAAGVAALLSKPMT